MVFTLITRALTAFLAMFSSGFLAASGKAATDVFAQKKFLISKFVIDTINRARNFKFEITRAIAP